MDIRVFELRLFCCSIVAVRGADADEKLESDSDVVNFKIVVQIEEVTVILSSMGRHVGKIDVTG